MKNENRVGLKKSELIKNIFLFRTNGEPKSEFASIAFYSVVLFFILFLAILINGQTFGQKCSKLYSNELEIKKCAKDFSNGSKN